MDGTEFTLLATGGPAALAAGGVAWRRFHGRSFWYAVEFPHKAARVRLTWPNVAESCGLTKTRKKTRLSGGKPHRVTVQRTPRMKAPRPTRHGFRVQVKLIDGQVPDDYTKVLDRLAHAWNMHAVRVLSYAPGRLTLVATQRDPLEVIRGLPANDGLLEATVGLLENGLPWVLDFKVVPHWLITGATQSGKSTLLNGIIKRLAPQPVAMVGFDLKGGVELTPYEKRMSALATNRAECVGLLDDLIGIVLDRMGLCRRHRVRNIWRLPEDQRPMPIVVMVDEVAELFLMADKKEKDEIARTATALLRVAQLGRAFGVYLLVCGQRVGSDLGPGVTALRAQLGGRICHRVNDDETAKMTLGDMTPEALDAARLIAPETPGVAITVGSDGRWHRARSEETTEDEAEQAATDYADLAPAWRDLTAAAPADVTELDTADAAAFTDEPGDVPAHAA